MTLMKPPHSSLLMLILIGAMWLIFIIGCTSGTRTSQRSTSTADPRIEYKHGSKIVVHYNAQQNKTFFSQGEIKISPEISVGSQKVSGKHAFEIDSTAESYGRGSPPDKVTLTFLHDTPTKTGWRYPRNTKFTVVADSHRFEMLCALSNYEFGKEPKADSQKCIQSDSLKKDDPSDADYYEALFMDLPFQTFAAIGNAKFVQIQIGTTTFNLPAETILAFHDFAETMAQK